METLNLYIKNLEGELKKLEAEKASKERQILRVQELLSKPDFYFAKEEKRNSLRFKKSQGQNVSKANKTSFKKNSDSPAPEKIEVPAVAVGPGLEGKTEEKKSKSWGGIF